MARDDLPPLIRDLVYASKRGLLQDDLGQVARRVLRSGIDDEFCRKLVEGRVQRFKVARAFQGPLEIPRLPPGDFILGLDERGRPAPVPLQALNGHALTLGGSGSGKTSRAIFWILQAAPRIPAFWGFDLRKREYGKLRPLLARAGVDLIVLAARQLRINPLQVPFGVEPLDWAASVSDMLVRALSLPGRAEKLLRAAVVELYRTFNILTGAQLYPTLFDLREHFAATKDANAQARSAILDSLDAVLMSLGPEVLAWRRGWATADLARHHIIFELAGVSRPDQDLLLQTLLLSEFVSRVARGISNPRMDLWICLDEAQRLVTASGAGGIATDLLGLIRGTGIGLDLSVQSGDIHPAVLSNTATKLVGRCGSAADYDLISNAMGLNAEQRVWMRQNLRPGLFVAQLGEGAWRKPFVLEIPRLDLADSGHDAGVHLGDLPGLPSVRA